MGGRILGVMFPQAFSGRSAESVDLLLSVLPFLTYVLRPSISFWTMLSNFQLKHIETICVFMYCKEAGLGVDYLESLGLEF